MAALSATLPHAPRAVHNTHSGAYEQAPLSPEAHAAATVAAVFVSALHKVQRQKRLYSEFGGYQKAAAPCDQAGNPM